VKEDPRRRLQVGINHASINRSWITQGQPRACGNPDAQHGIFALYQLSCDGGGCEAVVGNIDSRELIEEAHDKGYTSNKATEEYVLGEMRKHAYRNGWVVGRDNEDYCPACIKSGKVAGDGEVFRKGAGRRKAKR